MQCYYYKFIMYTLCILYEIRTDLSTVIGSISARLAPIFCLSFITKERSVWVRFIGKHLLQIYIKHNMARGTAQLTLTMVIEIKHKTRSKTEKKWYLCLALAILFPFLLAKLRSSSLSLPLLDVELDLWVARFLRLDLHRWRIMKYEPWCTCTQ